MKESEDFQTYITKFKNNLSEKIENIRVDMNYEKTMKLVLSCTAAGLIALAGFSQTRGYKVQLNDQEIAKIRREEEVDQVLEELTQDLCTTYDMDVILEDEIQLVRGNFLNKSLSSKEELKKEIKDKVSFQVQGYAIEIDGQQVGALRTKEEAESLVETIKAPYYESREENERIKDITTLEKLAIKKKEFPLYAINTEEQLLEIIQSGGEDIRIHTVEVGETLWTIAKIYDMTMEELIEANNDRDPDKLQIGDEVKLVTTKPLLTVATLSEIEYEEAISYESDIEYDDSMYDNEKETKREGKEGRAKLVAQELRHNGRLISQEIIKEEVLEEPVKELLVKGTKEVPKTRATGTLAMATRGKVSSRYGMRNGRMHKGLDISASTGTPINAADGGRVVFAGWSGAYGYLVEIDHENGFRTKYAHCSKIHVSRGDRVYKGQHIANVGNTGRSTGSHLHIEVLKNGSNVNPSKYLN